MHSCNNAISKLFIIKNFILAIEWYMARRTQLDEATQEKISQLTAAMRERIAFEIKFQNFLETQ